MSRDKVLWRLRAVKIEPFLGLRVKKKLFNFRPPSRSASLPHRSNFTPYHRHRIWSFGVLQRPQPKVKSCLASLRSKGIIIAMPPTTQWWLVRTPEVCTFHHLNLWSRWVSSRNSSQIPFDTDPSILWRNLKKLFFEVILVKSEEIQ